MEGVGFRRDASFAIQSVDGELDWDLRRLMVALCTKLFGATPNEPKQKACTEKREAPIFLYERAKRCTSFEGNPLPYVGGSSPWCMTSTLYDELISGQ